MDYISFVKGKKVYIWGAWDMGRMLDKELAEAGIDVVAYIDGKDIEADRYYNERKLLSANSILPTLLGDDNAVVLVACAEHDVIKATLAANGFEEGHNMLYLGNEITVTSKAKHYADFYGNSMLSASFVPSFTLGMKSSIRIGKNVKIGQNVKILAWGYSEIIIEDGVSIGDNCSIVLRDKSKLCLGKNVRVDEDVVIKATKNATISFADNCLISKYDDIYATNKSQIAVGLNTIFNSRIIVRICNSSSFVCGQDCTFSYYTKIRGENGHTIIDLDEKKVHECKKNISVGDHVWVGMGVTMLGGASISQDSIVGADSLVTKEFPANSLIVGLPAKVIKENVDWDMKPDISYEEWENKRTGR